MATLNIPNSFTNGTPANANEVNANFSAVKSFVEGSLVQADGSVKAGTGAITDGAVTADKIGSGAVTEAKLNASVAGNGLAGGGGTALSVNVDNSTIEINADALRLKDAGITAAKLGTDSVVTAKIQDAAVTVPKIDIPAFTAYTPTFKMGTTTLSGMTGFYMKIGKLVFVRLATSTSFNSSAATGAYTVTLPFAVNGNAYGPGYIWGQATNGTYYYNTVTVIGSSSIATLYRNDVQETYTSPNRYNELTALNSFSTGYFSAFITYEAA